MLPKAAGLIFFGERGTDGSTSLRLLIIVVVTFQGSNPDLKEFWK